LKVTSPACGVLALPELARRCPVKDCLDAAAHAARGLGLLLPDWLQNLEHEPCIDFLYRQVAQGGQHVGCKRVAPLLTVLRVTPPRLMRNEKVVAALAERGRLGAGDALGHAVTAPSLDRIDAFGSQLTRLRCKLAR